MKKTKFILPLAFSMFFVTLNINNCYSETVNKNQESTGKASSCTSVSGFPDFTSVAEQSINAVVHVMTKSLPKQTSSNNNNGLNNNDDLFNYFFGDRGGFQNINPQPKMASGSGVIIESDGYIVTNNHVVEGADSITVTLNDKRTFVAKIIGTDPSTDLALIKIDSKNLPILKVGDSEALKVGEWVIAVGNPFNLTSTVTAGIVSAKARNINILSGDMKIESFIQTDAAVNPGNSGGALVNTKGELIGINSAIASQTGSYSGYSFAIPASIMTKVVSDLKQYGVVQRALLGVMVNDISSDFAKEKDLTVLEGAYVASVNDHSAAKEAGMEVGDIITEIDGKAVKSVSEVQERISQYSPGNTVKVTIVRKKKSIVLNVVLKNQMGNTSIVKQVSTNDLGATFSAISDSDKKKYGLSSGLKVLSVEKDGKFDVNGIKPGFIIVKVNNQLVNSEEDLQSIIKSCKQNNGKNFNEQALFISGLNGDKVTYYAIDLN